MFSVHSVHSVHSQCMRHLLCCTSASLPPSSARVRFTGVCLLLELAYHVLCAAPSPSRPSEAIDKARACKHACKHAPQRAASPALLPTHALHLNPPCSSITNHARHTLCISVGRAQVKPSASAEGPPIAAADSELYEASDDEPSLVAALPRIVQQQWRVMASILVIYAS